MANIKVSEMTEATEFDDLDYAMIVQSNQNKKITKENMLSDINNNIGDLNDLTTTEKTSVVGAINELVSPAMVIERGGTSTTNYYAKYSDGTIVQWGEAVFTDAITTSYNGWYRPNNEPTKNLAESFINNQYTLILTGVGGYVSFVYQSSRNANYFTYWPISSWSVNNSNNKYVHFVAIGRWKE